MKVKCVGYKTDEKYFTKGKVYEVINDSITSDEGFTYDGTGHVGGVLKFLSDYYIFEEVKENETIVIYRKDNETIALDKRSGKKAVAKCCPDDAYDFTTGAKLAFERLTKSDKKPLNAKIIFTKGDSDFKTGHIYEIKDGKINLKGNLMPKDFDCDGLFYSIEDVKDFFTKTHKRKRKYGWSGRTLEFIEVVDN